MTKGHFKKELEGFKEFEGTEKFESSGIERGYGKHEVDLNGMNMRRRPEPEKREERNIKFPLAIGILPMLLSVIFGSADAVSEILIAMFSLFWLYQIMKVPWDLYFLHQLPKHGHSHSHGYGIKELRGQQKLLLLLTLISPIIGGIGLYQFRLHYPHYSVFLSNFNVFLFVAAALIQPFQHIKKIMKTNAEFLQEQVKIPQQVEALLIRMEKLENEIKELKGDVATQGDLTAIQGLVKPAVSRILTTLNEVKTNQEKEVESTKKKLTELDQKLNVVAGKRQTKSSFSLFSLPRIFINTVINLTIQPFLNLFRRFIKG